MAVLDIPEQRVKTGISHRYLRPSQAIVDPGRWRRRCRAAVVASAGLDVDLPRGRVVPVAAVLGARARRPRPHERPPYQGANPVADVWSSKALEYGGRFLRRAVARRGDDVEARGAMMLAASMAGVGFGSAGVHIPHACAYPIAGLQAFVRAARAIPDDHPFVPHGISVIVTAPAAFRFTYAADPARHEQAAALLGSPPTGPDALPDALSSLMADLDVPSLVRARLRGEATSPSWCGARGRRRGCSSVRRAR